MDNSPLIKSMLEQTILEYKGALPDPPPIE